MKIKTLILAVTLGFALCLAAQARIAYWLGESSESWSDGNNWFLSTATGGSGIVPSDSLTVDILTFTASSPTYTTLSLSASQSLAGLRFTSNSGYTIAMADGVSLQLRQNTLMSTASSATSNTIDGTILFSAATIKNGATSTVAMVNADNTLYVKNFDLQNIALTTSGTYFISSVIVDGTLTVGAFSNANAAARLTKNGAGTLALTGTSAALFADVRVNSGTLSLLSGTALDGSMNISSNTNLNTTARALMLDKDGVTLDNLVTFLPLSASSGVRQTFGTNLTSGAVTFAGGLRASYGEANGGLTEFKAGGSAVVYVTGSAQNNNNTTEGRQMGVKKTGSGTFVLNNANYALGTEVAEGAFIVNGTAQNTSTLGASETFDVAVASGAVLGGSGAINGVVTLNAVDAVVAVNSEYALDNDLQVGALNLAAGGTICLDVGDTLVVDGILIGGGAITLTIIDAGAAAGIYDLVRFGSANAFRLDDIAATVNGASLDPERYALSLDASALKLQVIPEPAVSCALLGLLGLLFAARRRR